MAYALLDDGFHSNPKLLAVGLAGMGLYAAALSYCGQYGTDGIVPMAWVVQRAGKQKNLPELLVEHHLWERVDVGDRVQLLDRNRAEIVAKIKQPAYLIRDFLEYNLSATQVREKREAKARAGSAGAKSKWQKAQQTYDSSHDTEMAAAIANDMANAELVRPGFRAGRFSWFSL